MNVNREKKEKLVKEISENFKKYPSFYLVDFINLPVYQSVELRKRMREKHYSFKVIKNRLALQAMEENFPESLRQLFHGPTAIAYAENDPVGLAKVIKDFSAEFKVLTVKGGFVEGEFLAEDRFREIANLSSKEDLLAKFGFLMAYPLKKLLQTWQAPFTNLGSMLSQLKSKK